MSELLGEGYRALVQIAESAVRSAEGTPYEVMRKDAFEALVKSDPEEAKRIYWIELLGRCHLACAASIGRHLRWLYAVENAKEVNNFISFGTCLRGMLESISDSTDIVPHISTTVSKNATQIQKAINKESDGQVALSPSFEDRLIHFSHARKTVKHGDEPKTHNAKPASEYLKNLEYVDVSGVRDLYGELCEIAHPAAASVFNFVEVESQERFNFTTKQDGALIEELVENYREAVNELIVIAFNPPLLGLYTLNKIAGHGFQMPSITRETVKHINGLEVVEKNLKE